MGDAAPAFVDLTADVEVTGWGNSAYDNPPMFRSTLWKIRCVVGTNAWLITASNQVRKPSREISFYAWHYTGSSLVEQWGTGDPTEPLGTHTCDFNGDPGSVQNAEFNTPILKISWLAFCSGPLLNRQEKQIPLPHVLNWLLPSDYTFPPAGLRNEVVRFDDDLGLPISIDVLSKGGDPVLQYRTLQGPIASPASTNVAEWLFPLEFRAIQYARNRKATNTWQADLIAHGKVTSIKVGSEPKF